MEWYPVTSFQRAMCLVDLAKPGSINVGGVLSVGEPVDRSALHMAGRALLRRHPALRYVFTRRSRCWWQSDPGVDAATTNLEVLTLPDVTGATRRRFSMSRGPLLRLVTSADGSDQIAVVTSHRVSDRWSLWLLRRDLERVYRAIRAGEELPEVTPRQFGEVVRDDVAARAAGVYDVDLDHWRDALLGLRVASASGRRPGTPPPDEAWELQLTAGDVEAIGEAARTAGATPFALLAGWTARAVAAATGAPDALLLAMASDRPRRSTWDLIGCFGRIVPLAFRSPAQASVTDADLAAVTAAALRHGAVQYDWIVEEVADADRELLRWGGRHLGCFLRSDSSRDASVPAAPDHAERVIAPSYPIDTWGLRFDVVVNLHVHTEKVIKVSYRPDRVPAETVRALLESIGGQLARVRATT
jgi:hypothetical protein